jgi:hypothetical protein
MFLGVDPSSMTDAGTVQVAALGAPVQVNETVPLKPLGATISVNVAVCPAVIVAVVDEPDAGAI